MKQLHRRRPFARAVLAGTVFGVTAVLGGCAHETASPPASSLISPSPPASSLVSPSSAASPTQVATATADELPVSPAPVSPAVSLAAPQLAVGAVPWGDVGPGWFLVEEDLATFSASEMTSNPGVERLWLVDPRGKRYEVLHWSADRGPATALVAWSPDAQHALFAGDDQVIDVDLRNATMTAFAVPHVVTASYAPQGSGATIVALSDDPTTNPTGHGGVLQRFGPHGVAAAVLTSDFNTVTFSPLRWLYSRDGAVLYLSDAGGLRTVSIAGGQARGFDTIEDSAVPCSPVRWWDTHTILVSCYEPPGSRLWLAPDDGGAATALSAPAGQDLAIAPDWGSFDAVRTAGGQIFVQRPAACGSVDIATLNAAGRAHHLAVPGSLGTDWLIGAAGDRIAIRSTTSENCYPRGWFGFYNPITHTTQQVINDPPGQLGAVAAVASD